MARQSSRSSVGTLSSDHSSRTDRGGPRTVTAYERYLNDPRRVAENQELPRAPLLPYPDATAAGLQNDATSPWVLSLDGQWHFQWADNVENASEYFFDIDYDFSNWDTIHVPGLWQTQGYDRPIYRNSQLAFWPYDDDNWTVPSDINSVGSYARSFDISADWYGRRTLLRFEGVQSAYFVWINGVYVGYDQGGMSPAEFDITSFVHIGSNAIAVRVFRWSAGSYLENFDYWHLSGIFRSVIMQSVPAVRIRDLSVITELDEHFRDATLRLHIDCLGVNPANRTDIPLRTTLRDAAGAVVDDVRIAITLADDGTGTATVERSIIAPHLWSDEDPYLYTLVLELNEGHDTFVTRERVGFRQWDVHDTVLRLNGKPVIIRGVNYIGHSRTAGRALTTETIRADLELMRQFNVNAIRNAHFPKDSVLYHLADEYGILICDEVDIETHARLFWNSPASRPEWHTAFLDRCRGMVHRNKNRPSVFMWSTGNEAGTGPHHLDMADLIRGIDPTRLLYHQPGPQGDAPWAHVHGPRYPELETACKYLRTAVKPVIFGEYMHSMGNSVGGFDEFWDVIRQHRAGQGGFIWDWIDQGLQQSLIVIPDRSPNKIFAHLNGRPSIVEGMHGKALQLSGLDDWVEISPHPALDITSTALTIDVWLKPGTWNAPGSGQYLAKGNIQYGLQLHDPALAEADPVAQMLRHRAGEQPFEPPGEVEFYLHNGRRRSIRAPIPDNWVGNWHRLTGVYDGTTMRLYIDGAVAAELTTEGSLTHTHVPVCIGRNPDLLTENTAGRTSNAAIDRVRIYNKALSGPELAVGQDPAEDAALALDFDEYIRKGSYDSYGASPFLLNGLVFSDGRPKPALHQVKSTHAPIRFHNVNAVEGQIGITNEYHSTDLSAFTFAWTLRSDGQRLRGGIFTTNCAPGYTTRIQICATHESPGLGSLIGGKEHLLEIHALRREARPGVPAEHDVAHCQWIVAEREPSPERPAINSVSPPRTSETRDEIVLSGNGWRYIFGKSQGTITSMEYHDHELLAEGPQLNVWRDPTSNDDFRGPSRSGVANQWRAIGLDRLHSVVREIEITKQPNDRVRIEVQAFASLPDHVTHGFVTNCSYEVDGRGDIFLLHEIIPYGDSVRTIDWLPRVGLELGVSAQFQRLAWYGRGPFENASDRIGSALIGCYNGTVDDQHVPYSPPQHNGLKSDVRWATLSAHGAGLAIEGRPIFNLEVTNYRNRGEALYPHQLTRSNFIRVMVDHRTTGVGETMRTGLLPAYRTPADEPYTWAIKLGPIRHQ